jgi:hypothetical protein
VALGIVRTSIELAGQDEVPRLAQQLITVDYVGGGGRERSVLCACAMRATNAEVSVVRNALTGVQGMAVRRGWK